MKRIVLLFITVLLLAACGSTETETETAVSVPEEPARPETAVPEEEAAVETEPDTPSTESNAIESDAIPGFPAATVQEASIVRDRDWTKGTDDPLLTIIEYGDFQ